ncbi:MAG: HD domain-containing phosphohydrolase [Solirubrobacterales bacterium]
MTTPQDAVIEQVEILLNVGLALSAEKDHNRLLEIILTEARNITRADSGTLYLRDGDFLVFKIMHNETMNVFRGGRGELIDLPPVPMRVENVSSYVALTRRSVNIPDVYSAEGFDFSGPKKYDDMTGYKTTSMLVIPLENHENEVIGVLQLINARDEKGLVIPFETRYEKIISALASQAAIALTNMKFMEDIQQLFNSFVEVMATAIDSQTPYNANHTKRVAMLSGALAQSLNDVQDDSYWGRERFDEDRIAQLVMAAWLHDVGKITTPLEVMNKSTRLGSSRELVLMRLETITLHLQAEYGKKKIAALEAGNAEASSQADAWWAEQLAHANQVRELVVKVDNPGTFVNNDLMQEISVLEALRYTAAGGEEQPWFTPDEMESMRVVKGTLTNGERHKMEDHVAYTRRMLDLIPFTKKLKDVPYFAGIHHELLDGKGYPNGLSGDQIPPEGRILALLDVFDALTASDRPYKKAMTVEEALKILGFMVKDGQLDGELLQIFTAARVWEQLETIAKESSPF